MQPYTDVGPRRFRAMTLFGFMIILGLLAGWVLAAIKADGPLVVAPRAAPGVDGSADGPLFGGKPINVNLATALLVKCRCPLLPDSGPAAAGHVVQSYFNPAGDVAFTFDNGMHVTYTVDVRSPEEYAADVSSAIAAGRWIGGALVPVRGKLGSGFQQDGTGPASLAFIEGDLVKIVGNSTQTLADLELIATSMKTCC